MGSQMPVLSRPQRQVSPDFSHLFGRRSSVGSVFWMPAQRHSPFRILLATRSSLASQQAAQASKSPSLALQISQSEYWYEQPQSPSATSAVSKESPVQQLEQASSSDLGSQLVVKSYLSLPGITSPAALSQAARGTTSNVIRARREAPPLW